MIIKRNQLKTDFSFFLGIVVCMLIIGLVAIYSASSVFALEKLGSAHYFLKKQIIGLLLGIFAAFCILFIPLSIIKKGSPYFLLLSLILTTLTIITPWGQHIHGSARWLAFSFLSFQPSELLKIALILYIAYFITKREKSPPSLINGYIPLLILLGITSLILLKQPDFGLTVTLITTVFILLFIAQIYGKYIGITVLACIPLGIILIIAKSYRLRRILTFLDPWSDAQGAGFQIIQSLIAIGSGGITGVGIGHSKQKFFYLPMQHTDFIFSIIAEEIGFIGASFIIFLYLSFLYFGFRIAWQLTDPFSRFATLGFVIVLSIQALINICVATGLAPTKGIGLPFISYGNTALIAQLIMVGLIILMVRDNKSSNHF